ncbi:MAG: T9SS type A sorting domain-containing protein [Saprospiraceae bacterium]
MVKQDLLTRCKGIPVFRYLLLSLLFIFIFSPDARSQTLACSGKVNISVDGICEFPIDIGKFNDGNGAVANLRLRIKPFNGNLYLQALDTIAGGNLSLGPNPVDFADAAILRRAVVKKLLGADHTYEIYQPSSANRCWGIFLLEDKLYPVITCPANMTIECADARPYLVSNIKSTSIVSRPVVTDNCGLIDSSLIIQDLRSGCGGMIVRHWSYTDCGKNKISCSDTIRLMPLDVARIMGPNPYVQVKCSDATTPDAIYDLVYARTTGSAITKDTTAVKAAYPFFKNGALVAFISGTPKAAKLDGVCSFLISHADEILYPCGQSCGSSRKIIRRWTVMDWCQGIVLPGYVQVIEATNPDGPTIVAQNLIVSVDPWNCAANFVMPDPSILHDVCDPHPTYYVTGPLGVVITKIASTGKYQVIGAPKGTHTFTYVAQDCCGKKGTFDIQVTVIDKTPPVAVAKQNIVLSLTTGGENDGIAKLFAASVDNGSYDSCTPVHLELRREDDPTRDNDGCGYTGNKTYNADGHPNDGSTNPTKPDFDDDNGAFVKFCCDDITNREGAIPFGMVKVWMRVWDDGDGDGKYGTAGDNYNETWVNVRIEDKLTPKIICPPAITINCDDDIHNLVKTGKAKAFSNCLDLEVEYTDRNFLNNCKVGYVDRTWRIKNNTSIVCVQRIHVVNPFGHFTAAKITWPRDTTTNCTIALSALKPTWVSGQCDIIGLSLKSDTFYFEGNSCMKILNRWTVIDWCTYDPQSTASSPPGYYSHTQIIKIIDDTKPTLASCAPLMFEADDYNDADNDGNKCETKSLMLTKTATDQGQCASDWLKWIVFVDLWGDGTTDYEYSSFLPSTDVNFVDNNDNGIKDIYVAPTGQNGTVKITIPEDIAGGGAIHKVSWRVVDGCGNVSSCVQDFMVVDKKKPTPYCVNVASALMKNGNVEFWAVDFNIGSFDNCTAKNNLLYTFNEASPVLTKLNSVHFFKGAGLDATEAEYNAGNAQKWSPATKTSGMVFDCGDLPESNVKMTVWDERFNSEFCAVTLKLQDNQGACGPNAGTTVSGRLISNNGQNIAKAEMVLDNGIAEMLTSTLSATNGEYIFNHAIMKYDYNISGKKNDDYLNGVSTLDMVLIQRHLLGIESLNDPYKLVAADVNNDEKVSASDLLELRKLILGIYSQLPKNDSWRFINSTQTFADITNPWPIREKVTITNLDKATTDQNFVAVKVGDVNGSASGNAADAITESRSNVVLTTEAKEVSANTVQSVVFNADVKQVYGLQFTLHTYHSDLVDIYVGDNKLADANIAKISENRYTVSWNSNTPVDGKEILTLHLMTKSNAATADLISMSSSITAAEIYSGDALQTGKLSLRFAGTEDKAGFELYQNEPNPFNERTNISFHLPEAGNATLKVFDVTGKVLYKNTGSFGKGQNSFTLTRSDLPSTGVMMYQIESGANTATKKMIGLE